MSTVTYKCPCCGAPLAYSGESGKLQCASCGNLFELEDLDAMRESGEKTSIKFDVPESSFTDADNGAMSAYICQNCGAELVTDGTTTATECAYCGSPAILPSRIEGGVKPEKVVPFKVTKEQAEQMFQDYFHGKRLLPKIFVNERNRIAEMRKLYVPYWLFDCDAEGDMVFEAEKSHTTRQGEWEVTHTKHYMVRRAGTLGFDGIPVDGSKKLDNKITESLEPYDLGQAVGFQPAVLSGAMADNADVDAEDCQSRAAQRVEYSTANALQSTVRGYDRVMVRSRNITSKNGKVTPVLFPVWLITTEKQVNGQKATYTFAINGQTGQLTCDVPYDKSAATRWFLGIFAGVCAAGYAILALLTNMGVF